MRYVLHQVGKQTIKITYISAPQILLQFVKLLYMTLDLDTGVQWVRSRARVFSKKQIPTFTLNQA
jgi:hypothetical protein